MKDSTRIIRKRTELQKKGVASYQDWKKVETLTQLLDWVDANTGQLHQRLYFRDEDVVEDFLFDTLKELGYSYESDEEYNPYHERFCYKIKLKK